MTPRDLDQQSLAASRDDDRVRALASFLALELPRGLRSVALHTAQSRAALATWTSLSPTDDPRTLARIILDWIDAEVANSRDILRRVEADATYARGFSIVRYKPVPTHVVTRRLTGGAGRHALAHRGGEFFSSRAASLPQACAVGQPKKMFKFSFDVSAAPGIRTGIRTG